MIVPGVPVWMILSTPVVGKFRIPPLGPTVMVVVAGRKLPAAPVAVFSSVEPLRLTVDPELEAIAPDRTIESFPPLLTVTVPVPMVSVLDEMTLS
jgi:hypothetical protein